MRHPILDQHSVIGWDIDQTLINGPNSEFFCAYVRAHPEKTHHLITFRQPGFDDEIYELFAYEFPRSSIASINCCPLTSPNTGLILDMSEVDAFKGRRAAELGCTIMVDDMEDVVAAGCIQHGVAFLNSYLPI